MTASKRFIEGLGLLIQEDGLPRIAGRMLGLFILEGGPISFSALADKLQVSRGSVSSNTRLLEQLGYIDRIAITGDRRDYYQLSDAPYLRLLDGYTQRLSQRLDLISDLKEDLTTQHEGSQIRLQRMQQFYNAALASAEKLKLELLQETERDH